jgi:hypothetical protein
VQVKTGNRRLAGTDDDVYLRVNNGLRFSLDKRVYDDFERGDDDTYAVPLDAVTRAGLSVKDITMAQIEKSRDRVAGGWFLQSFAVRLNGRAVASKVVNRWLEDNHRTARANIARDHRTRDIVPVWASLEEDDYLYGFDDDGDVNAFDRNTAVSFGYVPGPEITREDTGGSRLSGRLSLQNGEKGQFRLRMSTIEIVAPPPLPVVETPTPTPTPKPDLILTEFRLGSVTVRNQGLGPAGPFRVRMAAAGMPRYESFTGLAAGATATRTLDPGLSCLPWTAAVDDLAQVAESDETNNTRPLEPDTFC